VKAQRLFGLSQRRLMVELTTAVSTMASRVFKPWPEMIATTDLLGSMVPERSSGAARRSSLPGGFGEDALGLGKQPDALKYFVVGHRTAVAAVAT